ncbi:MAG: hydrogenase maturation nickel metallochaperone HypA, partial [Bacteroidales bacterium]|nr:hydrogenase maturation nickel metallochaperone HypA [Bacteroidales bacterium]
VKDSVLGNAKINITEIQAKAKCLNCLHVFNVEDLYTPCPECNTFNTEIISGKELIVKSLKVE